MMEPVKRRRGKGRPFKPGQSGNPKGRIKLTPKFREIQKLTRAQIEEIGSLILSGNLQKLKDITQNPDSNVLQVWIASGAIAGVNRGDLNSMNALLDRIVGRMPAPVEISGPDKKPIEVEMKRKALIELGKNESIMELIHKASDDQDANE